MTTEQKPTFANHADEVAWAMAQRQGGSVKLCATCEHLTMGYTCHICEHQYQEGSRYGRMPKPDTLCSDCATPCVSCKEPVCEYHASKSGECVGCSGPSDAEMRQADGAGSFYSSERMAALRREVL